MLIAIQEKHNQMAYDALTNVPMFVTMFYDVLIITSELIGVSIRHQLRDTVSRSLRIANMNVNV